MPISASKRKRVWDITEGWCWYCGKRLIWPNNEVVRNKRGVDSWFVVEHIKPLCQGGANDFSNLIPSCFSCNSQKGRKELEEYRIYLSMMSVGVTPFTQDQIDYLLENGFEVPMPEPVTFWGEERGILVGEGAVNDQHAST